MYNILDELNNFLYLMSFEFKFCEIIYPTLCSLFIIRLTLTNFTIGKTIEFDVKRAAEPNFGCRWRLLHHKPLSDFTSLLSLVMSLAIPASTWSRLHRTWSISKSVPYAITRLHEVAGLRLLLMLTMSNSRYFRKKQIISYKKLLV